MTSRRMFDVDPEGVASSSINERRLQRALGLVGNWVDTGIVPGASVLIARGDHLVVEGYRGLADIKTKRAASRDTLWSIASITKPVTAAAVMACVDSGLLSLGAPLVESLPQFNPPRDVRPRRGGGAVRAPLAPTSGGARLRPPHNQLP